jgi:hypothetical protein
MTIYARIDPLTLQVDALVDMTLAEYQAFDGNPKQQWLRPLVVDAKPAPGATQVVVDAGFVIEPAQVRQTWAVREMTAEEAEYAALQAEKALIAQDLDAVQARLDITNAAFNAMTTAQKFDVLREDRRVTLKAVKFLLRQAKRAL